MASRAKFFALYGRPFWLEAGYSGTAQSMVGPMLEIHDATTRSGHAALFGFLGVGAAERLKIGNQKLIEACLAQFGRIFGQDAQAPTATLYKDWATDPADRDARRSDLDRPPGFSAFLGARPAGRQARPGRQRDQPERSGLPRRGRRSLRPRCRRTRPAPQPANRMTMTRPPRRIDHLVLAVHDLQNARVSVTAPSWL
jgi:Flavin containing amine oxidoreductase